MKRILCALTLLLAAPAVSLGQDSSQLLSSYNYPEPAWSPYLAGALIGVLTLLTLTISKKPVGASSAYASIAGLIAKLFAPRHTQSLKYYQENKPAIDWTTVFVLGAVAGAFVAAWTGGELTGRFLQPLWVARFGADSHLLRTAAAFAGGLLMVYGARLAGGCTSGHGISGTLQLAVSSWIAVIFFLIGGIIMAGLLY